MKTFLAILLIILILFSNAYGEATPTDLVEIDDDDWGYVNIQFERRVYIIMEGDPQFFGDTVTLNAILIDFQPEDVVTFAWQYAIDKSSEWLFIDSANEQTYTFVITKENYLYWWRVIVTLEESV